MNLIWRYIYLILVVTVGYVAKINLEFHDIYFSDILSYFLEKLRLLHAIGYHECELYEIQTPLLIHILRFHTSDVYIDLQFMTMEYILKSVQCI